MTGFEIIILLLVVVVSAAVIGAYLTKGHPTLEEMTEQDDQEKVSQELYNKDLRPIVAKKAPKKDKVTEQVESMKKVVEAHDTLIKEVNKVSKSEFPIDKPKKKRKYYPKKK